MSNELWVMGYGLWVVGNELWVMGNGLWKNIFMYSLIAFHFSAGMLLFLCNSFVSDKDSWIILLISM